MMRAYWKNYLRSEVEEPSPPFVDLYETESHLVLKVDLPGVDPKEVLIKVLEDHLIIEGVRPPEPQVAGGRLRYLCMERNMRSFRRILRLPVAVNSCAGKAQYEDGVITLTFPKVADGVVRIKVEKQ